MTREEKQAFWQQHMNEWEVSGQSQATYCAAHDLKLGTFGYWRTQLCRQRMADHAVDAVASAFVPVRLSPTHAPDINDHEAVIDLGSASVRLPVAHLSALLPLLLNLQSAEGAH